MINVLARSTVASLAVWMLSGCGAYDSLKDEIENNDSQGFAPQPTATPAAGGFAPTHPPQAPTPAPEAPTPTPDEPSADAVPADFRGVVFLAHADPSGWAETSSLDVTVGGGTIRLNYDKATVWPSRGGVNANPWIFVFQDGRWYAATFEWLKFGQTVKPIHTVAGNHIKRSPLQNFRPRSGTLYGFMVSGLARDSTRNVEERTNVDMVRWP